jgi:alpha-L-fucosidase
VRAGAAAFGPDKALDGDKNTYWATDDGVIAASLEADLGAAAAIDRVVIQEHILLGQRVKKFAVEAYDGQAWKEIGRGQTIGYKRILRFPAVTAAKVRLKIEDARACPTISAFGLYKAPEGAK